MTTKNFIYLVCSKQFKSNKALISHTVFHRPGYKKLHKERYRNLDNKCMEARKHALKIAKAELIKEYNLNPKLCKQCNKPHSYEKRNHKTCSASCSATFSNLAKGPKSKETKNKISKSLSKKRKFYSKVSWCIVCGSIIKNKHKSTCSKDCLSIRGQQTGRIGGIKSASIKVKRSKDEIKLFELCFNFFSNVKSNYIISGGWDSDIAILDKKIAIFWNGPWHYKEMGFHNHSLKQVQNRDLIKRNLFESEGWLVIVYEDRDYTPEMAFEHLVDLCGNAPHSTPYEEAASL